MKLFVTGAAGFIGSNYVRWIMDNSDAEVTVFDALTYAGVRENLEDFDNSSRFRFIQGDITDREAVLSSMPGHSHVVHFAAESHVDRSIMGPDAFIQTNVGGTNVVCDIARQNEVERFLHISTDEVYGSIDEGSFVESDPLEPRSPYSASKASSDLVALAYRETYGLPVVITRSANQFGQNQFPEKVIPLFVTNLLDGLTVPLYGDGLNIRDWTYVEDNCAAVHVVLEHGVDGQIYNIGAGNELTNKELTMALLERCGKDERSIQYVEDRLGHDRRYSIDTTKIRSLGWEPALAFDDALDATVEWYTANRDWWEPLKSVVKNR
jgi:dTDP-glucose 4,6-dehydratase